jgi:hypothetical protein
MLKQWDSQLLMQWLIQPLAQLLIQLPIRHPASDG